MLHRLASVPPTYWLLWFGSLALSVSLIVLLRTRWGQSRPFQKCALLSLLVHAMLACLAMTVRVVVGDGGGGAGAPIRVRIVHEASEHFVMADIPPDPPVDAAPPLLEAEPEASPSPPISDAAANVVAAVDPPPQLLNPPAIESDPVVAEAEPTFDEPPLEDDHSISTPTSSEPLAATAAVEQVNADPAPLAATPAPPEAVAPPPAVPAGEASIGAVPTDAYTSRSTPGRLGLVERQGGNAQTEAAVAAALAWLARAQSPDGRWEANRFGAGQEQAVLGHDRGGAGRNADTGISALAILAFLGAGHTHQQGDYQNTVERGLEFLVRSQAPDGSLFGDATLYAQMYCHSMATFALAEARAMTGDARWQDAVERAVAYCLRAQHSATGGWRYRAGDTGDTSQLGWQIMALASARRAGVAVPSHTWIRIERFLRSVRRGDYGGLASYRPDSGASTPMTAEALYCRLLLEELGGERIDEAAAAEAARQLLAAPPDSARINLYYWYYATLALHHRQQASHRAARDWSAWNESLTVALVNAQLSTGPDAGSWNTNTVWGGYGGRVYTTAMAAMCLEAYYRYAPAAPRERWTATRPTLQDAVR